MKRCLLFLLLIMAIVFVSCGTINTSSRAKKLELGMTKQEVIKTMGQGYRIVSASKAPEGTLEVLRYESSVDYNYMIHLLDGKLVEWYEERPRPEHQHEHEHRHEK